MNFKDKVNKDMGLPTECYEEQSKQCMGTVKESKSIVAYLRSIVSYVMALLPIYLVLFFVFSGDMFRMIKVMAHSLTLFTVELVHDFISFVFLT